MFAICSDMFSILSDILVMGRMKCVIRLYDTRPNWKNDIPMHMHTEKAALNSSDIRDMLRYATVYVIYLGICAKVSTLFLHSSKKGAHILFREASPFPPLLALIRTHSQLLFHTAVPLRSGLSSSLSSISLRNWASNALGSKSCMRSRSWRSFGM